jgi:single-strand DNA-binding protein
VIGRGAPAVAGAVAERRCGVAAVLASRSSGDEPVNEVRLRGRWVGAQERELPSGDQVVVARLVVPRVGGGVDTVDCAVWTPALRRRVLRLPDEAVVEVTGSLRRRFWRTAGGPASRYEVEVSGLRRVGAAGSPGR